MKIWENINKYKPKEGASFVSWVFRIAHNLLIDYYRMNKKELIDELSDRLPATKREFSPVEMAKLSLDADLIRLAINKLEGDYKEVITLKYFNGLDNQQIGSILKCSEGNVRVIHFRALKSLKVELATLGINYDFN